MKNTNRYEEIINLFSIKDNNTYSPSLAPQKVTFKSDEEKQRYFQLNNIDEDRQEHFPEDLNVMAAKNIVITAEKPFIIPDKGEPVVYHFDTMTFESGGQMKCYASAIISVETLIKN